MADKYVIRVTAGPDYDLASQVEVPVNSPAPVHIASDLIEADLSVRVQNYRGLPRKSPATSPYFEREPHRQNGDQYSIAFRFRLKDPSAAGGADARADIDVDADGTAAEADADADADANAGLSSSGAGGNQNWQQPGESNGVVDSIKHAGEDVDEERAKEAETPPHAARGVSGVDLQFGNDFDHPIRDRLPPGFGTAMNIVKWWIDPGLEGDPYADTPYLYGPALSSFNAVHVGGGEYDEAKGGLWFEEGGDERGSAWRRDVAGAPPDDGRARMKWALKAGNKDRWTWEYGRTYGVDFYNPYIDFNEFALRLPGFNLPIIRYWDGQGLRYVLRNRATRQVYLVVLFTLHLAEDVNEDGTLKPAALEAIARASGGQGREDEPLSEPKWEPEEDMEPDEEDFHEEEALREARRKLSAVNLDGNTGPKEEDVD